MKTFVCLALAVNCVLAAHLGNTYIPPPSHANTAGGSNFLQTPNHGGSSFGSHFASSNQYSSTAGNGAGAHFGFGGQQQQQQHQGSYNQGASNFQSNQYQHQQQSSGQQIPIIRYDNQPNAGDGSFSFSYETGNGIQENRQGQLKQIGNAAGIAIQGDFSYPGDDGKKYALTYTADENGYRPVGDHLPTPPPIPAEIQKALELIARNPPQGAQNGAYVHSNEGAYSHQAGGNGGYGQQSHQGSYHQQGGHQQSSFTSQTSSNFGGNFGGNHGSFGSASTATSQQYLPPKNNNQGGFNGYKY